MRLIDGDRLYAVLDNIADHLLETNSEPQNSMAQTIQCVMGIVRDQPDIAQPPNGPLTQRAIDMVVAERARQEKLWGDQSGNSLFEWVSILGEECGELCEAVNETCCQNPHHPDRGGFEHIVKEASQVAAVALQIIEAACRRRLEEEVTP